jgi:hypothetical protein
VKGGAADNIRHRAQHIGGTSPNGWNFLKNPRRIGIHHARKMTVGCPLHAAG